MGSAGTYDAMFSDVSEDNVHAGDINCIAHYGITIGMGDGTYAPENNVTAFEMGLFVQRAADLMGADGEAVLGNVMLSEHVTRLEMAQLMFGLVNDIDDGLRYHPTNNDIERQDDAGNWHVVDDYFADARASVPNAESQLIGAAYELGITRGTRGDGTRISTADSTFEPFANVTRGQMASFIARTLDHSNLRPEGLSVQRNLDGETQISLRDGDFMPLENEPIDVFSALYPDEAFDEDDGECVLLFVKDETPSHDVCMIDIGDQLTDDEGNVEFELSTDRDPITVVCAGAPDDTYTFTSAQGSGETMFWAWTGSPGDEVNDDTNLQALEDVARPVGRAGPDYARLSGGLPTDDELAKMGETVTFTVQLHSDTSVRDGATLVDDAAVGPDRTGNVYLLQIERYHLTRVAQNNGADDRFGTADDIPTDSDYGDKAGGETKTGSASNDLFIGLPGDWNYGSVSAAGGAANEEIRSRARIGAAYYTPMFPNADGSFPIVLDNPDYHAAVNNTDVGVRFTLRPFHPSNDLLTSNSLGDIVIDSESNGASSTENAFTLGDYRSDEVVGAVIFSDDPSDPHSASGESEEYRIISGSRTPNTVTVTVVDQYGDPLRNVDVSVRSSLDDVNRDTDNSDDVSESDNTEDAGNTATDQAVYPEQVDITVQARENADGDRIADGESNAGQPNAGETTPINPKARFISLIDVDDVPLGSRAALPTGTDRVRTTRTVALRVLSEDGDTVANVAQDDVIGTFKTRRNGTYRIGYAYTASSEAQTETITPQSAQVVELAITRTDSDNDDANGNGITDASEPDGIDNVDATPDVLSENATNVTFTNGVIDLTSGSRVLTPAELGDAVTVYWTMFGTSSQSDDSFSSRGGDSEAVAVLSRDVDRRTIVANEVALEDGDNDEPRAYFYDEDDVFIIEDTGAIGASFEMFEEALGLKTKPDGCQVNEVEWENYTFWRDPDRYGAQPGRVSRTIWKITIS